MERVICMKKINILFLSLYPFSSLDDGYIAADLVKELVTQRCMVTVVTPTVNVNERHSSIKNFNNYTHIYIASGAILKVNAVKKMIGLKKLDVMTWKILRQEKNQYDLIITMVSHCAFYGAVKKIKKKSNAIVYNLVKDIFPQNAVDLGLVKKNSLPFYFFRYKERQYYKVSDFLGVISPKSILYFLENNKFLKKEQVEFNPNTINPCFHELTIEQKNDIRKKYAIPNNTVVFLYGGSLGVPQGIDFLLECITENERRENVFFLIIGSGTEYKKIEKKIDDEKIKNTRLYPSVSFNEFKMIACTSDVGMVFLNNKFTIPNYPSRVLSYMEARLPILFAVDENCDAADIAVENLYGLSCISGDIEGFNTLVNRLSVDNRLREQFGENGYNFLLKEYTVKRTASQILDHL